MPEANLFFIPVKTFCRRDVATCRTDTPLVEAAVLMRDRGISSVVVCRDGNPAGIFTDRDLRNKVIARGEDPHALEAASVMSSPLIVVKEEDYLFEALYQMTRHGIHRVGVVDSGGRLTGIITDSDLLNLQSRSPQKMLRDIERASTVQDLGRLHRQVQDLVIHLVGTGAATRDLVRMIAHLNDRLQIRLIEMVRREHFPELTGRFAYLVLGSEGRREQTLATDQDNALVYEDGLPPAEVERIGEFARALTEALVAIGVPPCPGGIMVKNAFWRRSLQEWKEQADSWLSTPVPENILNGSMFFDLRTLYGDLSFERELKAHVAGRLAEEGAFLARTAANVLRFKVPLGWLGRIRTETSGDHRGELEIKKAGIFAVTEGMKVLALEAGILEGGTRERLRGLTEKKVLDPELAQDLEVSFDFLVHLRLSAQIRALRGGTSPTNYLSLRHLNRMEKGRLKIALEAVKRFQSFLQRHYRLDLMMQ